MDAATLERRLAAANRTIAALTARVEERYANGASAFALTQQNVEMDRLIREKTGQIEFHRQQLEQALTDLRMAQAELVHAQKLESVGRLASGIAHEINTPVQFVSDNVQFLRRSFASVNDLLRRYQRLRISAEQGTVDPAEAASLAEAEVEADLEYLMENIPSALDQSAEGLDRVATLVRSMKEFAHPDQKQKAPADLNEALRTTITVARNEYKYVADVETDLGEIPRIRCLVGELNQVFLNLVVNAAHAIGATQGDKGQRGLIRIVTRPLDGGVEISVSDTGTGIPEEIRARVFDPFFTTKEVGKGTGQGLAIARSVVVDKHRGKLTFDTEVGRGTTFRVWLPDAEARAAVGQDDARAPGDP